MNRIVADHRGHVDRYKDLRPDEPYHRFVYRARGPRECMGKRGTLKRAFSEKKAAERAQELGFRAYKCSTCKRWHLTKQEER